MGVEELDKLLEESEDKLSVFKDREKLKQYQLTLKDVMDLVDKYLTDEEKAVAIQLPHFSDKLKGRVLAQIKDEDILMNLLKKDELIEKIDPYYTNDIVKRLSNEKKVEIMKDKSLVEKMKLNSLNIKRLFETLSQEDKIEFVKDKNFVKKNDLNVYEITDLIKDIDSEKDKLEICKLYELDDFHKIEVLKGFSDESKIEIIQNDSKEIGKIYINSLIQSMDTDSIIKFVNENEAILKELKLRPHEIVSELNEEKQLEIVEKINNMKLSENNKKRILVKTSNKVKENMNKDNLTEEEIEVLNLKIYGSDESIEKRGKICIEFDKNPLIYRGLEKLMYINPIELTKEERIKLVEFCEKNPNLLIRDNLDLAPSTAVEYVEGERWINSVLEGIDPNWSDVQKIAYVDNAIGKKISYSPDFDTEVFHERNARALWKIIATGKGVCNGISQVEKYILDSLGIESELVSGEGHAFLKIKNIEVPTEEGIKRGDTIVDPTWNLGDQRYGAKPFNFCKSYEEIRKNDINSKGTDRECHKNDEKLESATLNMDEKSLREVFKSIGLTNEDGTFLLRDMAEELEKCDGTGIAGIEERLEILKKYHPDFATCINSTMGTLRGTVLDNEKVNMDRCIVNRVYQKDDESKETKMYIYTKFEDEGEVFFIAGQEDTKFTKMNKEEFMEKYECYSYDLEINEGKRPWEIEEENQKVEANHELEEEQKRKIAANKIEDKER